MVLHVYRLYSRLAVLQPVTALLAGGPQVYSLYTCSTVLTARALLAITYQSVWVSSVCLHNRTQKVMVLERCIQPGFVTDSTQKYAYVYLIAYVWNIAPMMLLTVRFPGNDYTRERAPQNFSRSLG